MLGFGPTELLLVLAIILIIFGAGKLPQVLGSLGKGVKEFREASETRAGEPSTQEGTADTQNRTASHTSTPTTTV